MACMPSEAVARVRKTERACYETVKYGLRAMMAMHLERIDFELSESVAAVSFDTPVI